MLECEYMKWAKEHQEELSEPCAKVGNYILPYRLGSFDFFEFMPKAIDDYLVFLYGQENGYYEKYLKVHLPVDANNEHEVRSCARFIKLCIYNEFHESEMALSSCTVYDLTKFADFMDYAISSYEPNSRYNPVECLSIDWYIPDLVDMSKLTPREVIEYISGEKQKEKNFMSVNNKPAVVIAQKWYAETQTWALIQSLKEKYKDRIELYDEDLQGFYMTTPPSELYDNFYEEY